MISLQVRELRYRYPDGNLALNGVTFSIGEKEKVALVGPNGSGKSTLMLHLAGALEVQEGAILLNGGPASSKQLRGAVGLNFQDPDDQLFMPSVIEDVAFGPVAAGLSVDVARELAMDTLRSLGIEHLAERPPHRLSGGERRMASLAGILVMRPGILVLDEPTNSLDPRGRRRVIETLKMLDITALVATHDLDMSAEVCSRALVMAEGKVAMEGPLPGLFQDREGLERCGL